MSRWYDDEYDNSRSFNDEQEMHLLEKFQEYSKLERIEREKRIFSNQNLAKSATNLSSKYLKSAVIQIFSVAVLTAVFMFSVLLNQNSLSAESLSNSFNKSANWFFYGYGIHFVMIGTLIVSALFYKRFSFNLKTNSGVKKILKAIQFTGINVGGFVAAFSMLVYGISNVGITNSIGVSQLQNYSGDFMLTMFGVGVLIFLFGIISGTMVFLKQNILVNQKT